MNRCLYILTILSILPWSNTCSAQAVDTNKIVSSLTRCWRAISHEFSPIYGLEEEEVKQYSRQKICFSRDSITMYYGVQYDPKYSIRKVNAENYARDNFDCSKQKLDIYTDSVYEITITSVTKPANNGAVHKMTDVIAYDEDCIYVVADGVIFKLYDATRKLEGRSSN